MKLKSLHIHKNEAYGEERKPNILAKEKNHGHVINQSLWSSRGKKKKHWILKIKFMEVLKIQQKALACTYATVYWP